jgi:hypothetical protein
VLSAPPQNLDSRCARLLVQQWRLHRAVRKLGARLDFEEGRGFPAVTTSWPIARITPAARWATDENQYCNYLGRGIHHEAVNHSRGRVCARKVHTNSIESFWSLLKRGMIGTYHNVSEEYLPLYLNEFSFRFNNRKNPDIFDEILRGCLVRHAGSGLSTKRPATRSKRICFHEWWTRLLTRLSR